MSAVRVNRAERKVRTLQEELENMRGKDEPGDDTVRGDIESELAEAERELEAANREDEQHARGEESDDEKGGGESGGEGNPTNPADQIREAVSELEGAAVKTVEAAVEVGDLETAQQVSGRVVEELRRTVGSLESAGEAVEEAAEQVAEEAPPDSPAEEKAEEAVEAAHDAQEAAEEAEAAVREEVREQGGPDATAGAAAASAIEEEAGEAVEESPVEQAPAIEAEAEVVEEMVAAEAAPPPVAPRAEHPYFRQRKIRLFGREIKF